MKFFFALFLLSLLFSSPLYAGVVNCRLHAYAADFILTQGSDDVEVVLRMEYDIINQKPCEGNYYPPGPSLPFDVQGLNAQGRAISTEIIEIPGAFEYGPSYHIRWSFIPGEADKEKIAVLFKLKSFLTGDELENAFYMEWRDSFSWSAQKSVYRVIFPPGSPPGIIYAQPVPYVWTSTPDGKPVLLFKQSPTKQPNLRVRFSPGIASTGRPLNVSTSKFWNHDFKPAVVFLSVVILGYILIGSNRGDG